MIRQAGQTLGAFFSNPNVQKFVQDSAVNAAIEGGVGVATEQLLPRALGTKPQATLAESLLRQGVSSAVGSPVATGLQRAKVPQSIANLAGALVGQPTGQAVAQAILPGRQSYPLGIDPEPAEAGHPGYAQLMAKQKMDAFVERERYNNMINLAMARNYNPPSFIHHQSSGPPPGEVASNFVKSAFNVPSYG